MLGLLYEIRLCFLSFLEEASLAMEWSDMLVIQNRVFLLQLCVQCLEGCLAGCFLNEQKMLYNTPLRFAIGKGEMVKVG